MKCDGCGAEIGAPEPGDPWLCDACLGTGPFPESEEEAQAQLRRLRHMFRADGILVIVCRGRAVDYAQLAEEGTPVYDIGEELGRFMARRSKVTEVRVKLPDRGRS